MRQVAAAANTHAEAAFIVRDIQISGSCVGAQTLSHQRELDYLWCNYLILPAAKSASAARTKLPVTQQQQMSCQKHALPQET
jgi:hypothetical protein